MADVDPKTVIEAYRRRGINLPYGLAKILVERKDTCWSGDRLEIKEPAYEGRGIEIGSNFYDAVTGKRIGSTRGRGH